MDNHRSKLLIVDDKPSNLRFLSKILTEQGYSVQRAISAELALNGAMDARPDLILLDIIMPQMDGYEVCKRLKANPETCEIPVIFLSALPEVVDKVKAFEVGGVDYITKPFQVEEVLARIDKQLTIQRLSRQLHEQNVQLQQEIEVRKQAESQLRHQSQVLANFSSNLKQLHRLNTSHYNTLEDRFTDYLQTGCEILGFSTGIISKIENQTYTIVAVKSNLEFLGAQQTFNLEETYCAAVVRTKKTIAYAFVGRISPKQSNPVFQNLQLESYIGTPIFVNGDVYGTLNFSSPHVRHQEFAAYEKEFIELMAQSLGRAIAADQAERKRKQAEDALRKSETRFRGIFENAAIAIGITHGDGTMIEVNPTFEAFFGYSDTEMRRRSFTEITHPDDIAADLALTQEVINGIRNSFQLEKRYIRKDGQLFWGRLTLSAVRNRAGEFQFTVAVIEDINDIKIREFALRESERRFRAIFNNSFQFTGLLQPDGTAIEVNQTALDFGGVEQADVMGVPFWETRWWTISTETQQQLREAIASAAGGEFIRYEVDVLGAEDRVATIDFSLKPVFDELGKVVLLIPEGRDITERKQAEIALTTAKAALERQIQRTLLLNRITQEIRSSLHPKAIFKTAATQIGRAFGASRCLIHTYVDQPTPQIPLVAEYKESGLESILSLEIPVRGNLHAELLLARDCAIASDDVYADPLLQAVSPLCQKLGLKSMLTIRTSYRGKPNGAIGIHQYDRFRQWTEEEIELIETVAAQLGIAIAQANLLEQEIQGRLELARQNQQLQAEIRVRQQAEAALKKSEERWQLVLQGNNDGIYDWNLETDELFVSPRYKEMLGYKDRQFGDNSEQWYSLLHPGDRERVTGILQAYLDGKSLQYVVEYRLRCNDGSYKWILARGQALWDETGKPVRMVGSHQDISDRKQAEEQLRASQQKLSFLVQNTPLAVIEWNINREVVSWNQAAERIFGYSAEEAIGNLALQLLVPEYAKTHVQRIYDQLFTQQGGTHSINENFTQDGRTIICEWYNTPLIDDHGAVIGVASIAVDITERQQAKATLQQALEAAERANRAKSSFLASMSHELRTPLNAILGFSQILTRDASLTPEQQDYLGIINRSGEHLLSLINDVLSMSKIEAGRVSLNENCFDLYWLLNSIEDMLQLKAHSKGLQLTIERHADIPQYVKTDESKLRQVLLNLLGNATKFTQKGGVTLRVRVGHGSLVMGNTQESNQLPITNYSLLFEVEDTGPGIAADELDTLFDPFVQTQIGRQSMEGTGLGLPISRQFVQLMGGNITVRSTLGQGSIFTFDIKVSVAAAADVEPKVSQRRVIGLEPNQPKYRILIAEDIAENRKLLVKLLEPLGFEIREAVNGQEAIAVWQSWQPHLILMDIRMPLMDGFEATQQIKRSPNGQATVIIALTASAFEEQREAILQAGCDDFIRKPLREEILWAKIADHLGVRYICEENLPLTSHQKLAPLPALTAEQLQVMPEEWLQELHQATLCLDDQRIMELVEQIPDTQATLANTLVYLVDNFRLDLLLDCINTQ